MNEVTITVSGRVGSGKSAICGEIEILCKALGLQVEWIGGQQEKNLTHADWTEALEMYKPVIKIVEQIDRTPTANVAQGAEAIYQAKIIVDPKWTDVTKSEFDNYVELGGFDTRVVYAAPPAQTAITDAEGKRLPSLEEIQNLRDHGHGEEAAWWLERRNAALAAAQSASGDTK